MKILHLSHESLPDWRVEKSAITASKKGHVVFFGGKYPSEYGNKTFQKIYPIDWTAKARYGIPFYWNSVKKQVEKVIREVKPDIVHAHNIFSAKMISEFDLPFVYDDHEYWSSQARLLNEIVGNLYDINRKKPLQSAKKLALKIRRLLINNHIIRLYNKWEKELVSYHPIITVSDRLAHELSLKSGHDKKIFVVPNYPMRSEVSEVGKPLPHTTISCIYAGGDGLNKVKYPNRNIDELPELFEKNDIGSLTITGWKGLSSKKVTYKGYLKRADMYGEMSRHSIGLIPWKRHWSHAFVNPNKTYEYVHAGLFIMCTDSFTVITETLKHNCAIFQDYTALVSQLEYFKENPEELYRKRISSFEFAQANLFWEKNESKIFRAYQSS